MQRHCCTAAIPTEASSRRCGYNMRFMSTEVKYNKPRQDLIEARLGRVRRGH